MFKKNGNKYPRCLYRKIWWGDGWHFIFDHTNRWLILGRRVQKTRPVLSIRFGPVDLLIANVEDRRGNKNHYAADFWLRFTYWPWRHHRA